MQSREHLSSVRRCVVKVGSALLTNNGSELDISFIANFVSQLVQLQQRNIEIVLVSSGAVAAGVSALRLAGRPKSMSKLQAAAAVGQASLLQAYQKQLDKYELASAQVLITHEDIADRGRYLNARNTLTALLNYRVLPIVNENDTVVTDEIRFGDNDRLAAMVANLIEAQLLILLTDQDGLFDSDPRGNPKARLVSFASASDSSLKDMAGEGSAIGRGGMTTKLLAAEQAARAGASTIIASGYRKNVIKRIFDKFEIGTFLYAENMQPARKRWLAGRMHVAGKLTLDRGASEMLKTQGKSLLPVGIKSVAGSFERGDLVACCDPDGSEIARGLSNYSDSEIARLSGVKSSEISTILGYQGHDEVIHRDNLILLASE